MYRVNNDLQGDIRPGGRVRHLIYSIVSVLLWHGSSADAMSLEHMIGMAMQNPAIHVQLAGERAAKADADRAEWQYYPTPSVSIEQVLTHPSDPSYGGDGAVAILRLQQPVWTGGRLSAGKERAAFNVQASRAASEESRQQLALQVVQSYGDWLSAHLKTEVHEKSQATHVQLRERVLRRIAEGISAESDLTLVDARMGLLGSEIALARTQGEHALVRLGELTGETITTEALIRDLAAPRALPDDLNILLEEARRIHPAVRKAEFQARMQKSQIEERRADLMPEFYLRGEQQLGNFAEGRASAESRVFLGAASRFGAGLSTLSAIESVEANYQAALAEVEVKQRALDELLRVDMALFRSIQKRSRALEVSMKAAQGVSDSYDRQFLSGRRSWLDVMNAARELAQTEAQWVESRASEVVVTWRLTILAHGLSGLMREERS